MSVGITLKVPEDPNAVVPYQEEEKISRKEETQSLKEGSSLVGSGTQSESEGGEQSGTEPNGTVEVQSERSGQTETAKLDQEDNQEDNVESMNVGSLKRDTE